MQEKVAAIFLRTGVLTPQGLSAATALKQRDGGTLSEAILRLGLLDEEHLVSAFQKNLMIPRVSAAALARVPRDVLGTVPPHMAAELRVIPTDIDSAGNMTLAMVDPTDDRAAEEVAAYAQRQIQRAVASPTAMREALRTHYGVFLNKPGAPASGQKAVAASSPAVAPVTGPAAQKAAAPAPAAKQPAAQAQAPGMIASKPAAAPAAAAKPAAAQAPAAAAQAAAKPAAQAPAAAQAAAKPAAQAPAAAQAAAKPAAQAPAAAPAAAKPVAQAAAAPAAAKPAAAPAATAPAAAKPAAQAAAPAAAKPVAQAAAAPAAAKPAAAAPAAAKPAAAPAATAAKPVAAKPTGPVAPVAAPAKPTGPVAPVAAPAKPTGPVAPVAAPAAKPAAQPAAAAAKPAAQPVAAAKPMGQSNAPAAQKAPAAGLTSSKPAAAPVAAAPARPVAVSAAPAAKPTASAAPMAAKKGSVPVRPAAAQGFMAGSKPPAPSGPADPSSLKALARALNPGGAPTPSAAAEPGIPAEAAVFAKQIEQMRAASERDQVVSILLDCMTQYVEHVGLFVLQSKQLVCLDGRGPDHVVMSLKWFTVATEEKSPFNDVLAAQQPHIGPLADTPQNRAAMSALGSSTGALLLIPLVVGSRGIGVIYGDELKGDLRPLGPAFRALAQEAGAAFTRIILQRKRTQ